MWVAKQMGHANIEMVMKTYGRWIPDRSITSGYRPVGNWGGYMETAECPFYAPLESEKGAEEEKTFINQGVMSQKMASPRGFECDFSDFQSHKRQSKTTK